MFSKQSDVLQYSKERIRNLIKFWSQPGWNEKFRIHQDMYVVRLQDWTDDL